MLMNSNKKFFSVVKYIIFFIIFALLFNAKILYGISPFAFAFLFSLVWCNQNPFLLSALYILAGLTESIYLPNLVVNCVCAGVLILASLIHIKIKKPFNLWLISLYAVLSQLGSFLFLTFLPVILLNLINTFVGVIFMLSSINFMQAVLMRKLKVKLNTDEIVCGAVLLMAISSGLASLNFGNINIGILFVSFLILLFSRLASFKGGIVVSISCGLGYLLTLLNLNYLAEFCIMGAMVSIFANMRKIYSVISLLLTYAIVEFYFLENAGALYNLSLVIIAGVIFMLISSKDEEKILRVFSSSKSKNMQKSLIKISNMNMAKRLSNVSSVFEEMNHVFKSISAKPADKEEIQFAIASEVQQNVCSDCPNKNACYRAKGEDMLNVLVSMMGCGIEKKQLTLIDANSFLSAKCTRLPVMLSTANDKIAQFLKYQRLQDANISSRNVISDEFKNLAVVISKMSHNLSKEQYFNTELEKQIDQSLTYNSISAEEVMVIENGDFSLKISILLDENLFNEAVIIKALENACKCKIELENILPTEASGLLLALFHNKPKCDIVFGLSGCSKNFNHLSGDTHGLIKLGSGKYLLTLCDGMGSGDEANSISNKAISLIENFYRAGFDSSMIIPSVNKLLSLNEREEFTAIDLCILDLSCMKAEFIKLGAPIGFIKSTIATEIVDSVSLPIGILEETEIKKTTKTVLPKDCVVLISDGISEAFSCPAEIANYINNIKSTNPQTIADELLEEAMGRNGNVPKDDMTVLVARVFLS